MIVTTANIPKDTTMEEFISYIQASQKFSYTNYKQENLIDIVVAGLPAKKLVSAILANTNTKMITLGDSESNYIIWKQNL